MIEDASFGHPGALGDLARGQPIASAGIALFSVGEWSHEARAARWLDPLPVAVGCRFRVTNRAGRFRSSRICTVTELVDQCRFGYETDSGPCGDWSRWIFDLIVDRAGTRIIQTHDVLALPR